MNKKITAAILILIFLAGTVSALGRKKSKEELNSTRETVRIQGVVGFTPIEGGCWHITGQINNSSDAERFELAGVEKNRLEELQGKISVAEGVIRDDMASVCQIGPIFEVKKIELAEEPTNTPDSGQEEINGDSKGEGSFTYFEGDVSVKKQESETWEQVTEDTILTEGSEIKTEAGAYATVNIDSKKEADLNESSHLKYDRSDNGDEIDVYYGAIKAKVKDLSGEDLKIRTPVAVAAVRGTEFAVIYEEEDSSEVEVYDGKVGVASRKTDSPENEIVLSSNRWAEIRGGQDPEKRGEIPKVRKLRWKHLETKRDFYEKSRRLKNLQMRQMRLESRMETLKDEEAQKKVSRELEEVNKNINKTSSDVDSLQEELNTLAAEYKKIRLENADKRLELIDKKREEIIERRLREREEKLKERENRR